MNATHGHGLSSPLLEIVSEGQSAKASLCFSDLNCLGADDSPWPRFSKATIFGADAVTRMSWPKWWGHRWTTANIGWVGAGINDERKTN